MKFFVVIHAHPWCLGDSVESMVSCPFRHSESSYEIDTLIDINSHRPTYQQENF